MAVVLIDGFDFYTAAQGGVNRWAGNLGGATTGRFDGQSTRFTSTGAGVLTCRRTLPSNYSTLFYGFAFNTSTSGPAATTDFAAIAAGATNTCRIGMNVSGQIVIRNSGGTTIATGTTAIGSSVWHYIEVKLVINGASGTVEVHLDGAAGEIASTTGNFGSVNVDTIAISQVNNNSSTLFDDLYVLDTSGSAPSNTFLNDARVETLYPTSDGAHTQWTPTGGGAHYTQVNEAQADGDTTYVADGTVNDIDTYGFSDVDGGATVYGVQWNAYARKDDAAARQIAPVIRQASTDYVGNTKTLTASYDIYSQLYALDPTSAAWTAGNVNSDEFGVKEIA